MVDRALEEVAGLVVDKVLAAARHAEWTRAECRTSRRMRTRECARAKMIAISRIMKHFSSCCRTTTRLNVLSTNYQTV